MKILLCHGKDPKVWKIKIKNISFDPFICLDDFILDLIVTYAAVETKCHFNAFQGILKSK